MTAGWASTNGLPPIYVDKLTAGTLPSKHFRLVKEAERASKHNKNGRMSERQRSELLAALKKLPPIEPSTRRLAEDKDKKILALQEEIAKLKTENKRAAARARTPSASR